MHMVTVIPYCGMFKTVGVLLYKIVLKTEAISPSPIQS